MNIFVLTLLVLKRYNWRMERRQKARVALFVFFGLVLGSLGVSKLISADKIPWIEKGKLATSKEDVSVSAGACTLETADGGETFFVSCGGFLE